MVRHEKILNARPSRSIGHVDLQLICKPVENVNRKDFLRFFCLLVDVSSLVFIGEHVVRSHSSIKPRSIIDSIQSASTQNLRCTGVTSSAAMLSFATSSPA